MYAFDRMVKMLVPSSRIQATEHVLSEKDVFFPPFFFKKKAIFESHLFKSSINYIFPISTCYQIVWNFNSLTQSCRAACQRHERSFTHNNNPSKSALIGLWVITVLSLECFVFRFTCSVSKANNHSLFTVWVGLLFLPWAGQITPKSDSSQRKRGPTASLGSGKCSLKSRGQGRWLQPCSLLTLWQGQQRAGDMDTLYSCSPLQ